MGLLDFFKRDTRGATPAAAALSGEQAQQARLRARRRLIGAVVLLGVGVVAFPILFETQPRPIPVDIPIEIPNRDAAVPLGLPAPRPAAPKPAAPVAEVPAEPVAAASATVAPPRAAPPPAVEPAKTVAAPPPKPVAALPAKPPKETVEAPKPASPPPAASVAAPAAETRYVVQVGAFAEATAVREARAKVEKLGLVTYTQVVETPNGKRTRVRLGPYTTREEAEKAAAAVKAAGLPGAVLTL